MDREKVLFIYNPLAGKGAVKNRLSDVIEIFMRNEFVVTVYATLDKGDATEIVRRHGGEVDRIVCAGGDGTLHEVTCALMEMEREKRPLCGYIPTGTVNDFSNGIKLPKRVLGAAEIAASGNGMACDIGEMNGQFFTYVAAFGAFTSVSYETSQASKNLLGRTAYILDGVTKLSTIKSIHVKISTEDQSQKLDCILGMVTNAKTIGGLKFFKKNPVVLDDGLFEGVFMKKPKNPIELNQVMNYLLTGEINSQVILFHSSRIVIEAEEPVPYTLDGENGGEHKKTVIVNHRRAITYLVS